MVRIIQYMEENKVPVGDRDFGDMLSLCKHQSLESNPQKQFSCS